MPDQSLSDKMAAVMAQLRREMPGPMSQASIEPGAMPAAQNGGAVALQTDPNTKHITYDPNVFGAYDVPQMGDLLTHELTHVQQGDQPKPGLWDSLKSLFGGGYSYNQDPAELEAYQAQSDRAVRQHRTPMPTPNFSGPGMNTRGDITLPPAGPPPSVQSLQAYRR
jgi:hypothetical protein